ncbi:YbaN family protein [Erythrobacter rubeus]|uniref:YbaN family protein n=1 Tax=Erythrobacter rubeus TaxID=2760803 RepID=A0ABR8KLA6_9SPHN|nr:YbaN family protein [Erythrobacter rubeus]MBD2841164.1 YbaN family protein [Erythrobacter rubeus]
MRLLYLAGGIIALALAAIGAVLPIMPTVPFLLVAVFCFARSNPEWEKRIVEHPKWGPQIRDWREHRAISRPAKLAAIGAMSVGAVFTWFTLGEPYVWISLTILVVAGSWIATRNE